MNLAHGTQTSQATASRVGPADAALAYGALQGIVTAEPQDRQALLKAYAFVHLEEEIRREALVKDWGAFVRFLQLAAGKCARIPQGSVLGLGIKAIKKS